MNYNEVNIVNTETIMKQFNVNALVAKVIDAKGLTEEKFHALNEDYEYHLGDYSGAEDIKNIIKESYDNNEKFLIVSDPKLDNLFASIIVIRSLAKMKARFEIKYINKDEYMLKGNVIAIHDSLQFHNNQKNIHLEVETDLSLSTMAYVIMKEFVRDSYSIALASIANICTNVPLSYANRTLFKKAKEILENKQYVVFERFMITPEKRNAQLLRSGNAYTTYHLSKMKNLLVNPLKNFLKDNDEKRWNALLSYFFNPNKRDSKLSKLALAITKFKTDDEKEYDESQVIEVTLDEIRIDEIKNLSETFEPYYDGFKRPLFILKNVVVTDRRRFDLAKGLEISFRTDHGLVKATAYNNPVTKLDIKAGDTISIVGTLTINAFSGLPGLSIVNMEKHN
jgi:hypothetical protein